MASVRERHTHHNGGMPSKGDRVVTMARLPRNLRDQLNEHADRLDWTINDLLTEIISDYLNSVEYRTRVPGHRNETATPGELPAGDAGQGEERLVA